jgi:hypothetical protein
VAAWLQGGTGIYVLSTTYLAGLLPAALGDWSNIVGALCYIPLVGTDLYVTLHCGFAPKNPADGNTLRLMLSDTSQERSIVLLLQNLVLPMLMWNTVQHPSRWRRIGHVTLSAMWCMVSRAARSVVAV